MPGCQAHDHPGIGDDPYSLAEAGPGTVTGRARERSSAAMQGMQTTAPEAGSTTSPVPAQHSEQDRIRSRRSQSQVLRLPDWKLPGKGSLGTFVLLLRGIRMAV